MRTHQTMTVSLPPAMLRDVERVRKTERRTRSELVREALRLYFNPELAARIARLPVYTPTAAERRAIEKGRAEIARGEYVTVDELFQDLDRRRGKARAKGHRARA
jgi:Arc/MetJ-type ribon-helix-helix transcriptional regulator